MPQSVSWLSEGVHITLVGPDLVVLCLKSNAYYCLPGAARSLSRPAPGRIAFADDALAEPFEALGLISQTAPAAFPSTALAPPAPAWDLCDRAGPVGVKDRMDMAIAFGAMSVRFFGRSLWSMVRRASLAAPIEAPVVSDALIAKALAFQQLLPWVPLQGQCLYRAFMLLNVLDLAGLSARWVFGVRTWPFQAHCWLQAEGLVLDDAAERVGAFTPILIV